MSDGSQVLIESDWNLKLTESATALGVLASINRIRLEFKVHRLGVDAFWDIKY